MLIYVRCSRFGQDKGNTPAARSYSYTPAKEHGTRNSDRRLKSRVGATSFTRIWHLGSRLGNDGRRWQYVKYFAEICTFKFIFLLGGGETDSCCTPSTRTCSPFLSIFRNATRTCVWVRVGIERPGVRIYICARFQKEEDRLMNVVKSFFLSSVFTSSSCSPPATTHSNTWRSMMGGMNCSRKVMR